MCDQANRWTAELRRRLASGSQHTLVVDGLRQEDLHELAWAGGPLHIKNVARQLERVALGEVDYLAVRDGRRRVVAKGGVDYINPPGVPKLWQLATHPDLQGLGLGMLLIRSLEDRVRQRGFGWAHLGVEVSNPRALALYRHLGYEAYGREPDGWEQQGENGDVYWYETELIVMKRPL